MPDSKHLEDGIYELRTIQGTNIARCLYFFTFEDIPIKSCLRSKNGSTDH